MLYLAIDQHRKQLTVNLRNEEGDVLLRRQVSTRWDEVRQFFALLREQAGEGGFAAILEMCGFNDWLLKLLEEYGCREIALIQSTDRSVVKTDRRDANALGEVLWLNRQRLLAGKTVYGLRRVVPPSAEDAADRQLTAVRQRYGKELTRTINRVHHILLKHNLQRECPTKGLKTKAARRWLQDLSLPEMDRTEMTFCLERWELLETHVEQLNAKIAERCAQHATAPLIATAGLGPYGSLLLACRMNDIQRFPTPNSLANYWGLTPGCRNSGDATQRLGSITKNGSRLARFILAQLVLQVLRKDPWMRNWYKRIKQRRGAKIARVAVMRRLAVILWHMVRKNQRYVPGGPEGGHRSRPGGTGADPSGKRPPTSSKRRKASRLRSGSAKRGRPCSPLVASTSEALRG